MGIKKVRPSVSASEASDDNLNREDDESCGIQIGCGSCRSQRIRFPFLDCLNNAKCFLCLLSLAVLFQGMIVNGLINIIISTIEKRFHLQSSETGFIAGCYDLGFLIVVFFVTYVGGRGHKPQWIGWGVFIMGLGSITFSLPHFVAPTYKIPETDSYICSDDMSLAQCGKEYLKVYRAFFIVGHILHGIGACGLFTLVITYLDANVKKNETPLYHGIYFAFSVAGPGIGFIAGGAFIRLYTNFGEEIDIDESSAFWIGNWWLGFLIGGVCVIVISVPIILFPKQLPNTSRFRVGREDEIHQNAEALQARGDDNFGKRFKDIPRCLKAVLKNPTLVCVSIAGAMDSGSIVAISTFGPKFVESIFRFPPSQAGLYFGIGAIVAAFASHLVGGYLVTRLKPGIRWMLKFAIGCACMALCCTFVFLMRCETPDVPGVNRPFPGESIYSCEGSCGCSTDLYDPICGADGLTYLSLCDANCTLTHSKEIVNCTGIADSNDDISLENATAVTGKCNPTTPCPSVGFNIAIASMLVFFTFLKFQPVLQVSLRTVPLHQRSFAIGIQWVIMRCLGLIPLPLILGALLDASCIVWEEVCGKCASCRLYDNRIMSNSFTILLVCAKIISITSLLIALFTYKSPPRDNSSIELDGESEKKCETDEDSQSTTGKDATEGKTHVNKAFEYT